MYSKNCYEQPHLWAAKLLWEATRPFPKTTFPIQMNLTYATFQVPQEWMLIAGSTVPFFTILTRQQSDPADCWH